MPSWSSVLKSFAAEATNDPIRFLVAAGEGLSVFVKSEFDLLATLGGDWEDEDCDRAAAAALLLFGVKIGADVGCITRLTLAEASAVQTSHKTTKNDTSNSLMLRIHEEKF